MRAGARWLLWLALTGVVWGDPVELRAEPSLGSVVRYSRPFQLEVEMNVLDPTVQGEARLVVEAGQDEVSSEIPLQLSAGLQRVAVPILSGSYGSRVKLYQGSRILASLDALSSSLANDNDLTLLVLSPRKNHFGYLAGYKSEVKNLQGEVRLSQPPRLQGVPDYWWAYLGQDVIVLHDLPSLKLGDRLDEVLLQWVHSGGTLVLVANGDPHQFRGTVLEKFAPVPGGARQAYGAGRVVAVAEAVVSEEVLGGARTRALWRPILSEQYGDSLRKLCFDHYPKLSMLPELPTPATASLVWYLAIYVLVAVPSIYAYLRRKDQVLRLIVAIPACSLAFSLGAYYFNSLGRGRETLVRRSGIGWMTSGDARWLLDQTSVLFSPRGLGFEIPLPASAALRPDSQVHPDPSTHLLMVRGGDMVLARERLRQWGVSRWRSLSLQEYPGPLRFEARERKGGWELELDNQTGQEFTSAAFALDSGRISPRFSIPRGHSRQVVQTSATSLEAFLEQQPLQVDAGESGNWKNQLDQRWSSPALLIPVASPASFEFKGISPRQLGSSLLVVSLPRR